MHGATTYETFPIEQTDEKGGRNAVRTNIYGVTVIASNLCRVDKLIRKNQS